MNKWLSGLMIAGSAFLAIVLVFALFREDDLDESELSRSLATTMLNDRGQGSNEITQVYCPTKKPVKVVSVQPSESELKSDEQTERDKKIVDAIQNALDDEAFDMLAAQLKEAAASTNAGVRAKAVEALGWFAPKSLPELTMFMADADDDVRASAVDAYNMGLSQMEGGRKATAVRMGLSAVTDKDQLESMVMQVDDLSDAQKIDVLVTTINGKNKNAVEVARAHYEFVTGEKYSDRESAQKWLAAQSAPSLD